jgi:predicted secreted protein
MFVLKQPNNLPKNKDYNWLGRVETALEKGDFSKLGKLAQELESLTSDELWKSTLCKLKTINITGR